MKKMLTVLLTGILMILGTRAFAWDNKRTHPKLTEKAVEASKLADYLAKTLGFRNKQRTVIQAAPLQQTILDWLTYGSDKEDSPMCRAANHFHNPTIGDWKTAGQTDTSWTQFIGGDTCAALLSGNVYSLVPAHVRNEGV